MRRIVIWGLAAIVVLLGFYVVWPAWSARQIRQAIEANDPAALERRIDFVRVRERAKPLLAAELDRRVEEVKRQSGTFGSAIAGQLQASLGNRLVVAAVDALFTPGNVIDIVRRGADLKRVLKGVAEKGGAAGGPSGNPPGAGGQGTEPERRPRLGLANIKSYRITGPASIAVGIARDAASSEIDITAELAFTGGDWKVVGLVPRL